MQFWPAIATRMIAAGACCCIANAQQVETAPSSSVVTREQQPSIEVTLPALPPLRFSFSPTTSSYVLPPGSFMAATSYEGDALRHEKPDHHITEEFEIGMPYRINLAMRSELEAFAGTMQASSVTLEARWALADWNQIPLNPTLFAEYKFGVGDVLHEERVPEDNRGAGMPEASSSALELTSLSRMPTRGARRAQGNRDRVMDEMSSGRHIPDAVEGRILLARDFGEKIQWALNGFFDQEIEGDRAREIGFAQSTVMSVMRDERLKVGIEMLFRSLTDKDTRGDPQNSFVLGPTISWKPNHWARVDISPLFGVNDVSPHAQVFVIFSMLFGREPPAGEAEAPPSTRTR